MTISIFEKKIFFSNSVIYHAYTYVMSANIYIYIYILLFTFTGRIKELIITSGGENVASYNIEQAILSELSYLSNAMVIGDRRKYLTVLVTLKVQFEKIKEYKFKIINV